VHLQILLAKFHIAFNVIHGNIQYSGLKLFWKEFAAFFNAKESGGKKRAPAACLRPCQPIPSATDIARRPNKERYARDLSDFDITMGIVFLK